jgi:uncharacterized delta-60 repeat protein
MRTIRDLPVGVVPASVAALSLLSPLAWPATGDLDPEFGQMGEITLPGPGTTWSIQPRQTGFVLAGGYQALTADPDIVFRKGFVLGLDGDSASESWYAEKFVRDVAVDAQGGVVGVGHEVFRLTPDGALDPTFGTDGVVDLGDFGIPEATSIVLDDDARAVITATRNGALAVLRLLPNGEVDSSFGVDGFFTGPTQLVHEVQQPAPPQIVRVAGGYRVTLNEVEALDDGPAWRCWIVGLTGDGAVDASFGDSGSAGVHLQLTGNAHCTALSALADGRLLVAGDDREHGFAIRLFENGQLDTGFAAPEVAARMTAATALTVAESGGVLVAGLGDLNEPGALVVGLDQDGTLDASFGNGGATWLVRSSATVVRKILPLVDQSALFVGGATPYFGPARPLGTPFVFRLTGDPESVSPGVLSLPSYVDAAGKTQVVLPVRRTGGSAGEVSVAYETRDLTLEEALEAAYGSATEGSDYRVTRGLLTWSDGDYEDKQIVVPLIDSTVAEDFEQFNVRLYDVQGGAIVRSETAGVVIQAHDGTVPGDGPDVVGGSHSGGGAISLWLLLLLGAAAAVRKWATRFNRRDRGSVLGTCSEQLRDRY